MSELADASGKSGSKSAASPQEMLAFNLVPLLRSGSPGLCQQEIVTTDENRCEERLSEQRRERHIPHSAGRGG
eukprot:CAMPEP_0174348048 /NCGR_PEP_ID=MMETSP0811_2-20130205/4373_1 /TAXON_ID=73025 ORGANISM="Eutreptiella gymnastica-like, Strain CCMP1594" /NCGR_SAMPLE_ID=MMETSP0811_2 /ASSEMBLY_ACC=CAM_ASM_000667 /LENGTH=72 /DNA_ID=CAMNT_0015474225 /DNA_START=75 /DNA_END=289 /DNA_ORIENTATION=-